MADIKKKKKQAKDAYSKGGKKQERKPFSYYLIPYILVMVAIWVLLCLITSLICNPGDILYKENRIGDHILGPIGYYSSMVFTGMLGPAAFMVPILLIIFVIFWKTYHRRSMVILNTVLAFVAALLCSAFIHVVVNIGGGMEAFSSEFSRLFNSGVELVSGGVIGGYIGYGLYYAVKAGAIFVLVAVLIPIMMFLFGTTPGEVMNWIIEKIKNGKENSKDKNEAKKAIRAEKRKARLEREKEDKALALEQEKLDREAEREQEKLDREAAREQEKLDREAAREQAKLEKEEARRAAAAAKKATTAEDEEELILPADLKKDNCTIRIEDEDKDEDYTADSPVTPQKSDEEDDAPWEEQNNEDKLKLDAFSDAEKNQEDDLKTNRSYEDATPEEDEEGAERIFPTEDGMTVIFSDPNAKKCKKEKDGLNAVDDMAAEFYDEEELDEDMEDYDVDPETGEVFTPAVQSKAPKSAAAFRAETEKEENHFVGDRPAPPPPIPEYVFPTPDLLEQGTGKYTTDSQEIEKNAEKLRGVLKDFRIPVREISCSCGPTITRYEVKPEAGVRVKQIANLVDDIAMGLEKSGVRIEAPIPGKAAVGIEVPNDKPTPVKLRNLLENPEFSGHKSKLAACLGADVSGKPVVFDIEKMPHLLVAGTTGSGKSVCINSIIMSILYHAKPTEVKLLLIDPKQVEFQVYKDIPHLSCRIISDPKKAAGALNSAVNEMEKRFELIKEVGVRNITGYNDITKDDPDKPYMPRMVIIIDEFADLMMTARDEVETAVVRIAQKARAAGIHLIIGTQRPSADVITGLIKSNIPSRIAFTVKSQMDSRVILDTGGAEKLVGRGDMLYAPIGAPKPQRVQGTFVSDEEVERVVDFVRDNNAPVTYDSDFENLIEMEAAKCNGGGSDNDRSGGGDFKGGSGDDDPKLFDAAELAIDAGKISTSLLQRRLEIGYGRAAKIIDRLEEMGFVGPADGNKPRKILVTKEELAERMMNQE